MARPTPEEALGEVLRELRLKLGFSQEEMAEACDRDRTYISLLERGRSSASLKTLFSVADALGSKPSEILRRTEKRLK